MYPPFVEILSASVVFAFPQSWSRFHGVALLITGSVLSSPPGGCASDVYGLGSGEWRQQSPDSSPERRHRRLWTLSRAAGGVTLDRLADARRLILCEGVDERVSWKL
ncbi:unnamed protein product [Brassica oleracea var. botrytis]